MKNAQFYQNLYEANCHRAPIPVLQFEACSYVIFRVIHKSLNKMATSIILWDICLNLLSTCPNVLPIIENSSTVLSNISFVPMIPAFQKAFVPLDLLNHFW